VKTGWLSSSRRDGVTETAAAPTTSSSRRLFELIQKPSMPPLSYSSDAPEVSDEYVMPELLN
jgi:hypothetical protein